MPTTIDLNNYKTPAQTPTSAPAPASAPAQVSVPVPVSVPPDLQTTTTTTTTIQDPSSPPLTETVVVMLFICTILCLGAMIFVRWLLPQDGEKEDAELIARAERMGRFPKLAAQRIAVEDAAVDLGVSDVEAEEHVESGDEMGIRRRGLKTVEDSAEIENRESKIENSSGISLGLRASG